MNQQLEIEKTYLAKKLPEEVKTAKSKKIVDVYVPGNLAKPKIRLRQKGDEFAITKKVQTDPNDASVHVEYTIPITQEEFEGLAKNGRSVEKIRYSFDYQDTTCEVDVFEGRLKGLILVDFEFDSQQKYDEFVMPEYCLVDVTQEDFIAGKNLAGKSYGDISPNLERLGYKQEK